MKNKKKVCSGCNKKKIIVLEHELDLNIFDGWVYVLKDFKPEKGMETDFDKCFQLKPKHWYGYVGYVPILHSLVYWLWEKLHKKKIIELRYCKDCY